MNRRHAGEVGPVTSLFRGSTIYPGDIDQWSALAVPGPLAHVPVDLVAGPEAELPDDLGADVDVVSIGLVSR